MLPLPSHLLPLQPTHPPTHPPSTLPLTPPPSRRLCGEQFPTLASLNKMNDGSAKNRGLARANTLSFVKKVQYSRSRLGQTRAAKRVGQTRSAERVKLAC